MNLPTKVGVFEQTDARGRLTHSVKMYRRGMREFPNGLKLVKKCLTVSEAHRIRDQWNEIERMEARGLW